MRIPAPPLDPTRGPVEPPIRAELFGVERLEHHAESLAKAQPVATTRRAAHPLLARVRENGRVLDATYRELGRIVRDKQSITPAAEWLVDNHHVVDEQIREIRDDLPPGFYRELPKLAEGPLAGHPRVYGLAWAYVAHTDSRLDVETLRRFVRAYQRVAPLRIGELWAVAITLRVVLVENLRRLAVEVVRRAAARAEAGVVADRLVDPHLGLAKQARVLERYEDRPIDPAFAVELLHRLREEDPRTTPALRWLRQRLGERGATPEDVVRAEHGRQAGTSVSVRNAISSMRLVSRVDWLAFVERVSLVDDVLRDGSDFAAMDFTSRDGYRHAIEDLARRSTRTEARSPRPRSPALAASRDAATIPIEKAREGDPGYHLVGAGRRALEREIGYRPPLLRRVARVLAGDRRVRIPRLDRPALRRDRRGDRRPRRDAGRRGVAAGPRRAGRRGSRLRSRPRPLPPRDRRPRSAERPAETRAARGRARRPAHDGRRPDDLRVARGSVRAGEGARAALPRQPRAATPVRARSPTGPTPTEARVPGDAELLARRGRRDRAPQPRPRRRRRRRPRFLVLHRERRCRRRTRGSGSAGSESAASSSS